jgi:Transmembrane protein 43
MGALIGLLLIPGSILLIGWNEYRTLHRSTGLAEAEQVVVEVPDPFELNTTLNEKLVFVTGTATTNERLSDPDFGVSETALRLERSVEMYQWVEQKESVTRDKLGGGKETVTNYKYSKKWHEGRVDSDRFHERTKHANPALRYAAHSKTTTQATLGAFNLPSSLIESRMNSWKNISLDASKVLNNLKEAEQKLFAVQGDSLYYSLAIPDQEQPELGDLKIHFRVVEPATVSVLAKQESNELVPYKTSNGEVVQHLMMGNVGTTAMFKSLKLENTMIAWLCRAGGWVMACAGFTLIVGPLKALANVIPLLGTIVGSMTFFVAVLLGTITSLVTISLAWIAVRPLLAVGLLALAAAGIYWLSRRAKAGRSTSPAAEPPILTPL